MRPPMRSSEGWAQYIYQVSKLLAPVACFAKRD